MREDEQLMDPVKFQYWASDKKMMEMVDSWSLDMKGKVFRYLQVQESERMRPESRRAAAMDNWLKGKSPIGG